VIEQVAEGAGEAEQQRIGQRVVGTINCVCGQCDLCTGGLSNHCRKRTVLGIAGRDGCFADAFALPLVNLLPVPDGITDEQAVFTEPLAAAYNILQQLRIEGRPYVTVLGDGRLGLLVAQVMAALNATVRMVGKHPAKLRHCDRWGIRHRALDEIKPRQDQDIVVDCTGSADGIALAMQMVRPRGRIVLKTTMAGPQPVDLSPLVVDEIQVIGSRCGPFPRALTALAAGEVDVTSLISRRFDLADGAEAFAAARGEDAVKVLLEFD